MQLQSNIDSQLNTGTNLITVYKSTKCIVNDFYSDEPIEYNDSSISIIYDLVSNKTKITGNNETPASNNIDSLFWFESDKRIITINTEKLVENALIPYFDADRLDTAPPGEDSTGEQDLIQIQEATLM
jgi:hypothetical protein